MKTLKVLNIILLLFEIFLCVGGFIGWQIAFGHGLGDITYFIILYLLTLSHLIWIIKIWRAHQSSFLTPLILFSLTTLLVCLKATIWRGAEFSWKNRRLFYENRTTMIDAGSTLPKEKRQVTRYCCHAGDILSFSHKTLISGRTSNQL